MANRFIKLKENEVMNKENLSELYLNQKLSVTQIGKLLKQPYNRVRSFLLRNGISIRPRAEAVGLVRDLISEKNRGRKKTPRTAEQKLKLSKARFAWADKNAKGIRINGNGYEEYTRGPYKQRQVHVVLAELKTREK